MTSLRVLMLNHNRAFQGGGTFFRALHLGEELVRRGHRVTLISSSPEGWLQPGSGTSNGVELVMGPGALPVKARYGYDLYEAAWRRRWVKSRSFDIVHAFESRPVVIYPALAAQRQGACLVMDWCDWFGRGGSVEERPNPLVRSALRPVETYYEDHFRTQASGGTVINSFLRQRLIDLGANPASILHLPNGSDTRYPAWRVDESRRVLGLPQEAVLVGFVGSTFMADAQFMAAAFNELGRLVPGAKLVLVGRFNRDIEQWLDQPQNALRSGPLEEEQVYRYLAACDLCWLPLQDTGANRGRFPLKLNTYLSAGRAVVATQVGDMPQTILGLGRVTPVNPIEFARQTADLLANPAALSAMGAAARQAAETRYAWPNLAADLEAFYLRLWQPKQAAAKESHADPVL